ncbi:MAG: hypothetical protein ACYTG3_01735 [Planctomycetota bacterium]|jgi:hypothetical protein
MASSAALCLLVFLAPEQTYELEYRHEKGVTYRDAAIKSIRLTLFAGGQLIKFDAETQYDIERTVIEADSEGPEVERIVVRKFVQIVRASPEGGKEGTKAFKSQGKTFVWRRDKDKSKGKDKKTERWGLFDGEGDVTRKYPNLVVLLQDWRAARLPKKPVAVGDSWEVSAKTFLETVGQSVPPQVQGKATFKLKSVLNGVAKIEIEFKSSWRDKKNVLGGTQKGTWVFDVKRGRDIEVQMEGGIEVDNGKGGYGKFRSHRAVTYPVSDR